MSILESAKYEKLGKQAEQKELMQNTLAAYNKAVMTSLQNRLAKEKQLADAKKTFAEGGLAGMQSVPELVGVRMPEGRQEAAPVVPENVDEGLAYAQALDKSNYANGSGIYK